MGDQRKALYCTPLDPGARGAQAAPGRSSGAARLFLGLLALAPRLAVTREGTAGVGRPRCVGSFYAVSSV